MKTRQGLVSNSSTSSFICIVTEKKHEEVTLQISKEYKYPDIIKKILDGCCDKINKFGINVICFSCVTGEDGTYPNPYGVAEEILSKEELENIIADTEDIGEYLIELLGSYKNKMSSLKNTNDVFVKSDYY